MIDSSINSAMTMQDRDFRKFRELIYDICGINLTVVKKTMLASRLRKRLRVLGIESYEQYYDYVSSEKGFENECVYMLDAVSTNKTDFFREPKHFDYLMNYALPSLINAGQWGTGRPINIWSAGCSSGEEPYTIAMTIADFASRNRAGDFSILASDISTRVLKIARMGIYQEASASCVPDTIKRRFFLKGKGSQEGLCRVVPEIRNKIQFNRINLNNGADFGIRTRMDIIFCRNVIIYFDRETQKRLFQKFYTQLNPGGYLFIGHSETLHGISDQFEPVAVATYRKG
ncbi:MAG: protein-glutamate O-methyltransferase [Deltaproteobacteria bacterium]|nr:protein-glutamate O-methyltransferase [Deltaproteobacteria bacterium]